MTAFAGYRIGNYAPKYVLRYDLATVEASPNMIRNRTTNPFKLSVGRMPPYIAGRERQKSAFEDCIGVLTQSEESQAMLLLRQRRCGETIILNMD